MFNNWGSGQVLAVRTPVNAGAQEGNRTPDLRITSALLYRLSYLGEEQGA